MILYRCVVCDRETGSGKLYGEEDDLKKMIGGLKGDR
jgi:hypothetical protein